MYCADSTPFDTKRALANTIQCPVRYLSKAPPNVVTENYCFVVDGDMVEFNSILEDSAQWWKDTGTATRYYSTDCLKTFYQVTMLMSKGQLKTAYRNRANGGGMEQVPLQRIFRVSRYFSYWRTCHNFHRIVSLVNPVIKGKNYLYIIVLNTTMIFTAGEIEYGFKERIFIQYIWRTELKADKDRVADEYSSGSSVATLQKRRTSFAQTHKKSCDVLPSIPMFLGTKDQNLTVTQEKVDSLKAKW